MDWFALALSGVVTCTVGWCDILGCASDEEEGDAGPVECE
jgi:hypothetical protein